jgi:hypothetical protein
MCHSREIEKFILMLLSHYIWIITRDRVKHIWIWTVDLSEALVARVSPESFEDRPLLWMVVRS